MFWIIILCFIVLVALAVVIYTLPSDSVLKPKKKSKELKVQLMAESLAQMEAGKDWKTIAERWEKNNNALLGDVEKLKMQQKDLEKQLEDQKMREKDSLEKLSQEKS